MRRLLLTTIAAMTLTLAAPRVARATELELSMGASGAASEWRGDGAVLGGTKLGLRFADLVAVHALGRMGYATVDQRILTYLGLGAQIWGRIGRTRPYFRLELVHMHEEPVDGIGDDVGGVLFGVGDGIRHRGGPEVALGVDFPIAKRKDAELFATVEGSALWFPDDRGPHVYGMGTAALSVHFGL